MCHSEMESKTSLILAFIFFTTVVKADCPNGWMRYDESCYLMSHTSVDWADALTFCKALGGTLVEIESQREDNFIRQTLKNTHIHDTAPPHGYWIGLTDVVVKNEWVWIASGRQLSSMTYSNWDPSQPDLRPSENCGILWSSYGFNWHDDFCNDIQAFFICEKPSESGQEVIG